MGRTNLWAVHCSIARQTRSWGGAAICSTRTLGLAVTRDIGEADQLTPEGDAQAAVSAWTKPTPTARCVWSPEPSTAQFFRYVARATSSCWHSIQLRRTAGPARTGLKCVSHQSSHTTGRNALPRAKITCAPQLTNEDSVAVTTPCITVACDACAYAARKSVTLAATTRETSNEILKNQQRVLSPFNSSSKRAPPPKPHSGRTPSGPLTMRSRRSMQATVFQPRLGGGKVFIPSA